MDACVGFRGATLNLKDCRNPTELVRVLIRFMCQTLFSFPFSGVLIRCILLAVIISSLVVSLGTASYLPCSFCLHDVVLFIFWHAVSLSSGRLFFLLHAGSMLCWFV